MNHNAKPVYKNHFSPTAKDSKTIKIPIIVTIPNISSNIIYN